MKFHILHRFSFLAPWSRGYDYNCHGRFEYVDVDEMKKMIEVVYKIVTK